MKKTVFTILVFSLVLVGCGRKTENKVENQVKPVENTNISVDAQTSTSTADDINTENWQTYRNEEYGYEIKYPANYKEIDKSEVGVKLFENSEKIIVLSAPGGFDSSSCKEDYCVPTGCIIYHYRLKENQNVKKWISDNHDQENYDISNSKKGELDIVKMVRQGEGPVIHIFSSIKSDKIVELVYFWGSEEEEKISDSFKFTN